jgi:hypothetical protein
MVERGRHGVRDLRGPSAEPHPAVRDPVRLSDGRPRCRVATSDLQRESSTMYRMTGRSRAARDGAHGTETEGITAKPEGFPGGRRLVPGARLLLQVIFPPEYPIDEYRCLVPCETEPGTMDFGEIMRLIRLGQEPEGQDGLRRAANVPTLSVPNPRAGRRYEVEWTLPSLHDRRSWETTRRGAGGLQVLHR